MVLNHLLPNHLTPLSLCPSPTFHVRSVPWLVGQTMRSDSSAESLGDLPPSQNSLVFSEYIVLTVLYSAWLIRMAADTRINTHVFTATPRLYSHCRVLGVTRGVRPRTGPVEPLGSDLRVVPCVRHRCVWCRRVRVSRCILPSFLPSSSPSQRVATSARGVRPSDPCERSVQAIFGYFRPVFIEF